LELLAWIGHDVSTNWSWIVVDLVEKGRKDLLVCSGGWGMSYCHLSISVAERGCVYEGKRGEKLTSVTVPFFVCLW
jgi:hypothetical protein